MADPFDDMIEAGADALRIPLDPQWRAEIKVQLQVILRHGALVTEFPLPDDTEPALAFRA